MRSLAIGVIATIGFAACAASDTDTADTTGASTAPATPTSDAAAPDDTSPDEAAPDDTVADIVADTAAPTTASDEPATTDTTESEPATSEAAPVTEPAQAADESDSEPTTTAESGATGADLTADRPYDVFVPSAYDETTPTPLVLLLHGYTASGDIQEAYFQFEPLAESRGFLYVHPDGTVDPRGEQFWNATDACCAFGPNPPDDAAYLMAIIEQVSTEYNVDPKAVFLAGHSNGGFMSYRMACDHADTIAGIASLAGASFADIADCTPSEPVSVLQVHGTDDETIAFTGGAIIGSEYPSAAETVGYWSDYNGCDATPTSTADVLDLDSGIDGAESDIDAFAGCSQGTEVNLWTIDGGRHVPPVTEEFSAGVIDFLLAHPKP
ncbi:MAG: PHB depolymerase family esterase [Ilumatobacter sp.]